MARKSNREVILEAKKLLISEGYELIEPNKKKCLMCGESKAYISDKKNPSKANNQFYMSHSRKYGGEERLPFCKKCIEDLYIDFYLKTNKNSMLAMYKLCQEISLPWVEAVWEMCDAQDNLPYKNYMQKLNSLKQYAGFEMENSDQFNFSELGDVTMTSRNETFDRRRDLKDAVNRWGSGWSEDKLVRLENFYHDMRAKNRIETPQDDDYLRKLAMLSIQIDDAILTGESAKAKSLGDLYSKYMTDAKFRAQDMTDADKQGGIRTFSQIYEEVERDDFIPPWEKFANIFKVGQDVVDKTIMHIENFTLKLNKADRMIEPPIDTPDVEEDMNVGD